MNKKTGMKLIGDIYKNGYYWNEGHIIYCNFGDKNTEVVAHCRNEEEAKDFAMGKCLIDVMTDFEDDYVFQERYDRKEERLLYEQL